MRRTRQTIIDAGTPFRIIPRADFTFRLMVGENGVFVGNCRLSDRFAIDLDVFLAGDFLAQLGALAIDTDPACLDQLLELATGTVTGIGQEFLQALFGNGTTPEYVSAGLRDYPANRFRD